MDVSRAVASIYKDDIANIAVIVYTNITSVRGFKSRFVAIIPSSLKDSGA
jgi:hypothetical protein